MVKISDCEHKTDSELVALSLKIRTTTIAL